MLDVVVLALEDAPSSSATGLFDTFLMGAALKRRANEKTPWRVRMAGLFEGPVAMSAGLSLVPHTTIGQCTPDLVLIPGLGVEVERSLCNYLRLYPWLNAQKDRGAQLASVCTGAFVLAEAGLLDHRPATTHWLLAERFARRYPKVDFRPELLLTSDQGVYCSGGANASFDMALFLIELLAGHELSRSCANALLIDQRANSQVPYANFIVRTQHNEAPIKAVQLWLEDHLAEPLTVDTLAARAKMSPRTFKRRFKAATSEPPVAYLQRLRIERAKHLLERTSDGVEAISAAVGYDNVGFFRKLFRRYTAQTPLQFRQRAARTRAALRSPSL